MSTNRVLSPFVNAWRGLAFWSGIRLRNRLIFTLQPAKESQVTNSILGLCVIVSVLVPITAIYELVRTARAFRDQEAAISFSTAAIFVGVIGVAFYRRVFVWPGLTRPASETEQHFEQAAFSMLSTIGGARWKLVGISAAQAAITMASIIYVKQHLISGVLVIYIAVWLPAAVALALAMTTAKVFHAGDDAFYSADKALMGAHVSVNLTVVAFIVAGLLLWAASMLIGLAVFVLGGLILWRVFAGRIEPANTAVFETAQPPGGKQWRDASVATHVDGEGKIRQAHTGRLVGNVDASGRVTDTDGAYQGSVGSDGQVR